MKGVAEAVVRACRERDLELPRLLCEPGRSLVATAGLTLYTIGSRKQIPGLRTYLSVDGGMSDNPRPITYQSSYTAVLAERPTAAATETVTVAGKHCESGDVLLKDLALPAQLQRRPAGGLRHRRLQRLDGLELQPHPQACGGAGAWGRGGAGAAAGATRRAAAPRRPAGTVYGRYHELKCCRAL